MKYIKLYSFATRIGYQAISLKSDNREDFFSEYQRAVEKIGNDAVLLNVTTYLNDVETGGNQ